MTKITHIVSSIDPASGGPSYTVPALVSALARAGHEVELLSTGQTQLSPMTGLSHRRFERLGGSVPFLRKLCLSPRLKRAVNGDERAVLHAHGLWQMPLVYAAAQARARKMPLVVAPRGMLAAPTFAYSPRIKRIFGLLWQDRALAQAAAFHATAPSEYNDIRAYGLRQPVAVLPNGVDIPDLPGSGSPRKRTVLFLGRLHHKKGLDLLLDAWAQVEAAFPDWSLRIIGPDDGGHAAELERKIKALRLGQVTLEGPVFEAAKWQAYFEAGLFILPTRSENFGMTVAESLAAGVPAICTKGAPWQGLEDHGCGWWVDVDTTALAGALRKGMEAPDAARHAMGQRGRKWMQRDFSWDKIAYDTVALYQWLLDGGRPPEVVQLD